VIWEGEARPGADAGGRAAGVDRRLTNGRASSLQHPRLPVLAAGRGPPVSLAPALSSLPMVLCPPISAGSGPAPALEQLALEQGAPPSLLGVVGNPVPGCVQCLGRAASHRGSREAGNSSLRRQPLGPQGVHLH